MAAIPLETKYIEKLPEINDALFDSPNFHQNLFNWTLYVDKLESKLSNMAFVFDQYKSACKNHIEAGLKISHAYQNIKELFSLPQDIQISQNLDKFSECLSRIFSYQETLSIQTSNLIVEKLQTIVEEAASLKSLFKNVVTQYHNYQMSMDKAYDCPSYETSVDPSLIDKLSVKSIECKSVYQNDVITYLTLLRSFISNKKLEVVQKLLEFMFVHFSYSNFSKTVLDENDESMSIMFDKISTEMKNNEVISKKDNKSAIELISTIEKNNTDDILQFPLVNEKPSNSNQVNMSVVSTGSQWIRNKVSDYLIYRADRKMFLALNKSLNENEAYRIKTSIQNLGGLDVTSSGSLALFNSSNIGYGNILHLASNCMKLAPNFDFVSREHLNNLTEDYNIIKKGYMRLKLPSNILNQSKYQSLFFGVDASKGLLLAQGIDQSNMVPFVSLNTATVKESFPIETDRNFCFQIITPKGHCILQAFNPRDRNDWILAIQSGIMSSLKHVLLESGSEKTQSIFFNSKSLINNWWMSIEGNHKCADCEAKDPEWASFNIGVVICIECSGVHRSLGVQISKVRSLNLDTWDELMRNSFLSKGNKIVNSFLEADLRGYQKIRSNTNSEERHAFIRLKYVDKMFMKILTPLIQLKLN